MNTKIVMMTSSIVLGLAGVVSLFLPQEIVTALGLPTTSPLPMLIQLVGGIYFSLALMNWTAKDSIIGGIYSRPLSLGNFAHFFIGTLILAKDQLSNGTDVSILVVLTVYAIFAMLFWWLAFRHSGASAQQST